MDQAASDHLLTRILGANLQAATLRMIVGVIILAAIAAALAVGLS